MKKLILFLLIVLLASMTFAAKVVKFPDLKRPFFIKADDSQLYITDGPTVSIFSLKDFSLVKKFGRAGEGPQEFKVTGRNAGNVMISLNEESIIVNSVGKVSFYTLFGEYLSESNTQGIGGRFHPLGQEGNLYVGDGFIEEGKTTYTLRNLYDEDFVLGKELYRRKTFFQQGKSDLNPFYSISPIVEVHDNKIFINGVDNEIYVFDIKGNKIKTITYNYDKLKVTDDYKERVITWYKTYPSIKRMFHMIKGRFKFPEHFPGIRLFNVADGKIYVLTFNRKEKEEKSLFVIFDVEGNYLEKVWLPFSERDIRFWSPYTIKNNTLYQLIDNENSESWELHITKIK